MKTLKFSVVHCFLFLVFAVTYNAQDNSSEIYAESWSTDHLRQYSFHFDLNSSQNEYSKFVRRSNDSGYKLTLQKMPAGKENYQYEYWFVTLRENFSKGNSKKEKLGCNLLSVSGCGSGGDYFPREDLIGILFPREMPQTTTEKYITSSYYPISLKRIIKVKSFYVIIKVDDYKMNVNDPKKIETMSVNIEFKSRIS